MILGGIWANKISGKLVLGFGVIWSSATTVLTPIAARVGLPFLIVMCAFMGIGEESEEEVTNTEQAENWFSLTYAQRICGQMVSTTADIHTLFRGWRRSGCFLYKPEMESICCPSYTIRLKPSDLAIFTLDFSGSGLSGGEHVTLGWNEVNVMEPKMQGIAAAWIDVEDHQFHPPASKLISELVYKVKNGQPANEAVVAEEEAKLARVLDVYEKRLIDSKFLGGDKFTSADLTHLPYLYHLMRTPVKRLFEERRRVSDWCAGMLARPAWTKVAEMVEEAG
ncbi:unnamed protein product [Camellia sinensis]